MVPKIMILHHRPAPKAPTEGDYKITHHFALWPVWIDHKMVWLERYKRVWEWEVKDRIFYYQSAAITIEKGGWELRQVTRSKTKK